MSELVQSNNSELSLFETNAYDRLMKASMTLAKSMMIPYHLRGKPQDVFATLCLGAEMGLKPMQSLTMIYSVNGIPCMASKLMLGMVLKQCKEAKFKYDLDEKNLRAVVTGFRGDEEYTATWDLAKAAKMGLIDKKGSQYKIQPITMLKWRAVCEILRVLFPDIICGLYGREELQDFEGNNVDVINNQQLLEEDYPIPEEEKEIGSPDYRIQHAKFRGKQLKDIDRRELEDYVFAIDKRKENKGVLKDWENEVYLSITNYLTNLETVEL